MEIAGSYYFEGAVYLVVAQLILVAILNFITGGQRHLALGLILIIFADAVRSTFLYNHFYWPGLKVVMGNLHINVFLGPLLYVYLTSITKHLKWYFLVKHLVFPLTYILIVLSIALLSYNEVLVIGSNIYLYETKLALFLFYLVLTIKLIRSSIWQDVKYRKRYLQFLVVISTFIILNLVDLLFWKHFYQTRASNISVFFYLSVSAYILVSIFLVYYGVTELNWVKKLFVSSKKIEQNIYKSEAFDLVESRIYALFNQDRIHTEMDLNLDRLAKSIGVKKQVLSDYLHVREKKSFYDLINEWRVKEFKTNLTKPEFEHLDILGVAYESGFSSKATFNRVFKKMEGVAPKEFRASIRNNKQG